MFGLEKIFTKKKVIASTEQQEVIQANYSEGFTSIPMFSISFDGEKNRGEIGDIVDYTLNYEGLRLRSWKSFLTSDVSKAILGKFTMWVVGTGLKMQYEPMMDYIDLLGKKVDKKKITKEIETNWKLFVKSKRSSYDGQSNLQNNASVAHKNANVSGDCLIILRVDKEARVTVDVVDGENVTAPFNCDLVKDNENHSDGVVKNKKGQHIAYIVCTGLMEYTRVEARDKNGFLRAWLFYGDKHRIDNDRGIPRLSSSLETLAKIDRYKEAAVGSAEERAKIVYSVENGTQSTGESPMTQAVAASRGAENNTDSDEKGQRTADFIAKTTNKSVVNMPKDSKLEMHDTNIDVKLGEFLDPLITVVTATIKMPIEVALSKYESNYSASRAAIKDWEQSIRVDRGNLVDNFYNPIFSFWLNMQVASNRISLPILMDAIINKDYETEEALKGCRWIGVAVPHIDPLKEVKAEREKLGVNASHIPLTSLSEAMESLGMGDYNEVLQRFKEEIEEAKDLKPEKEEPVLKQKETVEP